MVLVFFSLHEISRASISSHGSACNPFSRVSLAGITAKGNHSGFNSTPVSTKYRHFGTIVLPVDTPGVFSCFHHAKKQAYREAVGSPFHQREDEWENVPGTGTPGRPAPAKGLLPCDHILTILIYK